MKHGNTGNQYAKKDKTKSAAINARCDNELKTLVAAAAAKAGIKESRWICETLERQALIELAAE